MNDVIKEIQIGTVLNAKPDDFKKVVWDWQNVEQAIFAVLGNKHDSIRTKFVKDIAGLIHESDQNAVYWITTDTSDVQGEGQSNNYIRSLESFGDISKEFDPEQIFRTRRTAFINQFFETYSQFSMGKSFGEIALPISYRSNMEGPLNGYERMINELDQYRRELEEGLKMIDNVKLYDSTLGKKYVIQENADPLQQTLEFTLAVWNFWSMICLKENKQPFLLIVELPKSMMISDNHDTELKRGIVSMMSILKSICDEATVSMILSSETMFPIYELNIRQRIFLQTHHSDFDMFDENSRQYFGEEVYIEWDKGNHAAACIVDEFTKELNVVQLHVSEVGQANEV